jgi:hypothetical protein
MTQEFGLTLPFALLAPEFVVQFLQAPAVKAQLAFHLSPLDDVRTWLRAEGDRGGEARQALVETLLSEEKEERARARAEGRVFDLLDFEFSQMEREGYDAFSLPELQQVLTIILDEADALRAAVEREAQTGFNLGVAFSLSGQAQERKSSDLGGMLNLDLVPHGQASLPEAGQEAGVMKVPISDPRAGDETDLVLSLAYPMAEQERFLQAFRSIAGDLSLKKRHQE